MDWCIVAKMEDFRLPVYMDDGGDRQAYHVFFDAVVGRIGAMW